MTYFINNTRRAVTVGQYLFIPGRSVAVNEANELKKLYPQFAKLINDSSISKRERGKGEIKETVKKTKPKVVE